ncbi:SET domain-containing protein [Streptomyces otsuchiensis]|uniref:SET domain-containing protein n=1 Tax=Streptomyces otsuchiensis TaxID=2681388 RepID=UPI001D131970|nr:SET domain-containing protein [Streptomyces otsuchiensis]
MPNSPGTGEPNAYSSPSPRSWLHPDAEVRSSPVAGDGLFARAPIRTGTMVCRLGGRLISDAELRALLAEMAHVPDGVHLDTVTVSATEHLLLPPRDDRSPGYGNHSCDPNLWWHGPFTLVARRDIRADQELTNDYATSTDDPGFVLDCACAAGPECRGVVTGDDWRRADLRVRYGDHWVPALLDRIRQAG